MQIKFEDISYIYQIGTPYQYNALENVNLVLDEGKFYAIIGHTGSGKSTLIQHINALIKPTRGVVRIGEYEVRSDKKNSALKNLRQFAGLVFQFPEYQLFEETVEKDIMFGPKNFGVSDEEARNRAHEALKMVGLSEDYLQRSPFELSGGQMRRVAIAGVLAMNPSVLILDEPTAGLDPRGQKEMMDLFKNLQKEYNKTIVLVSHNMNDVARYADYVIAMNKGQIYLQGTIHDVFKQVDQLNEVGLDVPESMQFVYKMRKSGINMNDCYTTEEVIVELKRLGYAK